MSFFGRSDNTNYNPTYKIVSLTEGSVSSLLLGESSVSSRKIEECVNHMYTQGYYLTNMHTEKVRNFIFWSKDSVTLIFLKGGSITNIGGL